MNSQPDIISRTSVPDGGAIFYGGCDLHEPRDCVIEKLFVTLAEIILACAVSAQSDSVFHTSAATYIEMAAEKTLIAQILLIAGKGAFNTACGEFF